MLAVGYIVEHHVASAGMRLISSPLNFRGNPSARAQSLPARRLRIRSAKPHSGFALPVAIGSPA